MGELAKFIEKKMTDMRIDAIPLSKKVGCSDVYIYKMLQGRNVSEDMLLRVLQRGLMCKPDEITYALLLNIMEREPKVKPFLERFLQEATDEEYDPQLHKLEALARKAKKKKMLSKLIQLAETLMK